MKTSEMKQLTDKVHRGKADKVDEIEYNYYVSCWGI